MRRGTIFERALKWMALLGVAFALGGGAASAQITVTGPAMDTVMEGEAAEYTVTVEGYIATTGTAATVTVTVGTPEPSTDTDVVAAGEAGEAGDIATDNSRLTYEVDVPAAAADATAAVPFSASGTILVRTSHDDDAENEKFTLAFAATGVGGLQVSATDSTAIVLVETGDDAAPTALTIDDDEEQEYLLTEDEPGDAKEGTDAIALTLKTRYPIEDSSVVLTLGHSGGSDWALDTDANTGGDQNIVTVTDAGATPMAFSHEVTLTHNDGNDGNRGPDTVTVTMYSPGVPREEEGSLDVMIADIHALPAGSAITAMAYDAMTGGNMVTSVEVGDTVYLAVEVDRGTDGYPMGEKLDVALSLSDDSLATLEEDEVEVDEGTGKKTSSRVSLEASSSNMVTPGTLMVNLNASGADDATNGSSGDGVMGTPLSLTITQPEGTEPKITAKSQAMVGAAVEAAKALGSADADNDGFNPGEMITLDPSDLFELSSAAMEAGYVIELTADGVVSSNTAAVGAGGINGMARIEATAVGSADVTITARAKMGASSFTTTIPDPTLLDEAHISVSVVVVAAPGPDPVAPSEPQNLTATAGDAQVTLAWTAPESGDTPTGYQYRVTVAGVSGEWMPTSSDTGQTVTGLTNGTEYTFEVRAMNAAGEGPAAMRMATPMATVDPVAPTAPQNLTATAGDAQVMLAWTAPESGDTPTGYQYRRSAGGISAEWVATSSTATTHTVTGLENGTEYTFVVRAVVGDLMGAESSPAMATPMAPVPPVAPSAPQDLTATAGNEQVTLAWTAPASGDTPTGYEYHVMGAGITANWMSTSSTATTHTVTGLANGTEYTFQVRAMNAAGTGPASASAKAIPMAPDPGVQVTVKEVKVATGVAESGGLEVTVVATVPAGTKVNDKVAPIASRTVMVSFPTDDASILAGEDADAGEVTPLGATGGAYTWTNIKRTEKEGTDEYKFRVAIGQDLDAEDEKFQIEVRIDGAAKRSKVVTIDDAQEQTYALSLPSAAKGAIKEGGDAATLTLKADPARTIDIPAALVLNPNDPSKYTLGSLSSNVFGINAVTASISAKADGNRVDDTITVTAYSGLLGAQTEIASLDITVTDANALPAVKATLVDDKGNALDPQPESVMEGETVKVMLTAVDKDGKAMKAAEKLTITLMPTGSADGQDYRLSSQSFEIAKDKESSAAVDLMVTENQDVGEETLMFDAAVAGESKIGTEKRPVAGVLSLMITDGTDKLVWANSQEDVEAAVYAAKSAGAGDDMTFTEGEMIEVMGALLFSSAPGVSVSYTAESDMSGVASTSVSGGTVMVTAVSEGTAHITITAHASMPSGVKIVDQTAPGMASIMFPVEVGLEALSIMLSGPEDANLAEGMSAMVTATANRPVSADTTVMLMRDRSESTAGDADYSAEPIVIAAGSEMGSTMVMAIEDNMAEDMEELVLYGMTEGMAGEVTGEVHLHLWDAAVPALPVIAQLLLAAFLAVGGYRRYRRR